MKWKHCIITTDALINLLFLENGIDDEAFLLLNDDSIKELIPNMGVRLKFKKKYCDYMAVEMKNKNVGRKYLINKNLCCLIILFIWQYIYFQSTLDDVIIIDNFSDLASGSDNLSESSSTITKVSEVNYITSPLQNIININDLESPEVSQKRKKENEDVLFENVS